MFDLIIIRSTKTYDKSPFWPKIGYQFDLELDLEPLASLALVSSPKLALARPKQY